MKKILLLFAAMLVAFAANAKKTQITPTSPYENDAVRLALYYSAEGDTIVLAGGTYEESNSDYIAFKRSNVVMAKEGENVIIKPHVSFRVRSGARAELIGVKIDASELNTLSTSYENIFEVHDATEGNCWVLRNCEVYGNSAKTLLRHASGKTLDSVIIDGCYIHDNPQVSLRLQSPTLKGVIIKNSTFANIANGGTFWCAPIDISTTATDAKVVVDHCTFYHNTTISSSYADVTTGYDGSATSDVTVSNCIFAQPESYASGRAINLVNGGVVKNCLTYNYTKSTNGIQGETTKTNCVAADPEFVDAANANYAIGSYKAFRTATDHKNLGDPRWGDTDNFSFTVAGSSATLFGSTWAPTATDNDMVENNGIFTFTKENVPLPAGNIEFKVVENHDWDAASYPADNYVYNIASADFYNVSITFDPSTKEISVEATQAPATEYKTLYFQATYDWWKWDTEGATAPGLYAWQGDVKNAAWPGAQMQPVEGEEDIWSIQIDARFTNIIFTRLLASTGAYKGIKTIDLTVPTDGKDQYTLTKETYDWGNYSEQLSEEDGVWGVFTPYVPTLANGYYLIGCINGVTNWTVAGLTSDQLLSVNPENDAEYIIKTTLAIGDQFKVVNVQHDKGKNWYPDGNDNNYIVDANHDGLMDIYFNPNGGQAGWHEGYIYATPAPYVRKNAVANKWGTICLPWNATIENAKAYYIGTEISVAPAQDATVVVEEVVADGELYAGKTYLIKAIADGDITANFNLNANKKTSPEYYNNLMGNLEATPATILASDASYDYYILSENAFHHLEGTASATVAQYKGYLRVAKSQGAPGLLRIVEAENQATSIEGLDANETATKFIENGKLYILRDGVVYDAMGKMVK